MTRVSWTRLIALALAASHAAAAESPSGGEVLRRLDELERRQAELSAEDLDRKGRVGSYFAESLSLGGYFEHAVAGIWGPATSRQLSANSHVLGLNLGADLGSRFRLVSQFSVGLSYSFRNPHNNPSHGSSLLPSRREFGPVSFGSVLAHSYAEYESSEALRIRLGLGYVPFGRAFQLRDPVLFLRRGGPQMIRTSGVTDIVIANPFWTGLHVLGSVPAGDARVGYDAYSVTPISDSTALGGGARLWTSLFRDRLTAGFSWQASDRDGVRYHAFGADLELKAGPAGLLLEASRSASRIGSPFSVYVEPYLSILGDKVVIHLDADYLRNPLGATTLGAASVSDPYIKWEYGGGINWLPAPAVRMRLLALVHDYVGVTAVVAGQDRDFYSVEYSTGVSF